MLLKCDPGTSSWVGLMEWTPGLRSIRLSTTHGAVRDLDDDEHGVRRRPGLLDYPGRHLGQALTVMHEAALADFAALSIDHEPVVRL